MVRVIFLEEFGKAFVPKKYYPVLRGYLLKAGVLETPYKFFGMLFYLSALITTMLYILWIYPFLNHLSETSSHALVSTIPSLFLLLGSFLAWFGTQFLFSVLFILLVYFYLDIRIFKRTSDLEEQLPEFLQVVTSNLRGGLTFENAIWASIKPQFPTLAQEMAEVSKKVMTGYQMKTALMEFADKYDSHMLRRSIDLILSEMESGGNVADLLDRIVDHLKEIKALKQDMSASSVTYVIFISVIVIVISPLLFSLAYSLLLAMLGFTQNLAATTQNVSSALPFSIGGGDGIDPADFRTFAFLTNSTISLFASMIVSIVEKGKIKSGLKYIPLFLGGSAVFYFIFMNTIPNLFSNLF